MFMSKKARKFADSVTESVDNSDNSVSVGHIEWTSTTESSRVRKYLQ